MIIAIDGACRRNGTPTCLSVGSCFIKSNGFYKIESDVEKHSTSQRGELRALIGGLNTAYLCVPSSDTVYLITDSEYVFNTISKGWINNWERKNWVTSAGEQVKNKDLWQKVKSAIALYKDMELVPYHIKGHLLSFGKAAAKKILLEDEYGDRLYSAIYNKLTKTGISYEDRYHAIELFKYNHGHAIPDDVFDEMVTCNTVADLVAGYKADIADIEWSKNSYM